MTVPHIIDRQRLPYENAHQQLVRLRSLKRAGSGTEDDQVLEGSGEEEKLG